MAELKREHINVSLGTTEDDERLKHWVRVQAAEQGISMAAFVKQLIVKAHAHWRRNYAARR